MPDGSRGFRFRESGAATPRAVRAAPRSPARPRAPAHHHQLRPPRVLDAGQRIFRYQDQVCDRPGLDGSIARVAPQGFGRAPGRRGQHLLGREPRLRELAHLLDVAEPRDDVRPGRVRPDEQLGAGALERAHFAAKTVHHVAGPFLRRLPFLPVLSLPLRGVCEPLAPLERRDVVRRRDVEIVERRAVPHVRIARLGRQRAERRVARLRRVAVAHEVLDRELLRRKRRVDPDLRRHVADDRDPHLPCLSDHGVVRRAVEPAEHFDRVVSRRLLLSYSGAGLLGCQRLRERRPREEQLGRGLSFLRDLRAEGDVARGPLHPAQRGDAVQERKQGDALDRRVRLVDREVHVHVREPGEKEPPVPVDDGGSLGRRRRVDPLDSIAAHDHVHVRDLRPPGHRHDGDVREGDRTTGAPRGVRRRRLRAADRPSADDAHDPRQPRTSPARQLRPVSQERLLFNRPAATAATRRTSRSARATPRARSGNAATTTRFPPSGARTTRSP